MFTSLNEQKLNYIETLQKIGFFGLPASGAFSISTIGVAALNRSTHRDVLANAAALHAAVEGGSVAMMARVLELSTNVDELDSIKTLGWECYSTLLLREIMRGRTEAVRILLENRGVQQGEGAMGRRRRRW